MYYYSLCQIVWHRLQESSYFDGFWRCPLFLFCLRLWAFRTKFYAKKRWRNNIFWGRKWGRKFSRLLKNACDLVEIGTRRILYPSCIQIYNFPPSIYYVGGVPVLKSYLGQEFLTNPITTTTFSCHTSLFTCHNNTRLYLLFSRIKFLVARHIK